MHAPAARLPHEQVGWPARDWFSVGACSQLQSPAAFFPQLHLGFSTADYTHVRYLSYDTGNTLSQLHSPVAFLPQEHLTPVDVGATDVPWVVKSMGIEDIAMFLNVFSKVFED